MENTKKCPKRIGTRIVPKIQKPQITSCCWCALVALAQGDHTLYLRVNVG